MSKLLYERTNLSSQCSSSTSELLIFDEVEEEEENESSYRRYNNLISNLPKGEGWASENHIVHYQGFWYADIYCPGVLAVQEHFKARSSDIIIASTPKSGTVWIKSLLFATVTRSMYSPTYKNHPLLIDNPHNLVQFLESRFFQSRLPDLELLSSPRLFATHIPFTSLPQTMIDSCSRIVYVCRNLKDVFVSMWHFTNKIRATVSKPPLTAMEAFERFCKGVSHFGPFWDHVLVYLRASLERPQQVLFIKYEELQADPGIVLKRVAQFVGFPFTSEEENEQGLVDKILRLSSFENLTSLEVNKTRIAPHGLGHEIYFRKGTVGDWANYLTSDIIERIDQITEEKFYGYGLKF
ncbi:cytosolic sulfotransferase 7-like [Macadamia integrifolia]|uniref:cytosolic sulfotransferase 7-like n=1 Tax=Macadamia integrifolia TaxID=60698 RepID=UPI001C4EC7E6|nr:cytosolic sulfotransferase 7-like [Macadamia integrifolia]